MRTEPGESLVESDGPLTLVAGYESANGSLLQVFETEPGVLIAIQSAAIGTAALVDYETARLPVVEMFERVSGAAAPATLVHAAERQTLLAVESDETAPQSEVAGTTPLQEGVAKAASAEEQSFLQDICSEADKAWIYRTGSGDFTWKNIHEAWSYAFAYRGDIRLWARVRTRPIQWNDKVGKVVKEGTYDAMWRPGGTGKFDWNAGVNEADGDGYHFCSTR